MPKKAASVGSKVQVWHGTCQRTSGGLTKGDLMKNKNGKIVSKKQHAAGLRVGLSNLSGYAKAPGRRVSQRISKRGGSFLGDIIPFGNELGLAYTSTGGAAKRRKVAGRRMRGGNILDDIANTVGNVVSAGSKIAGLF